VQGCKRGSAKHSVRDDFVLKWKRTTFRHLPNKNPDENFTHLIISVTLSNELKIVTNYNRLARGSSATRWNLRWCYFCRYTWHYSFFSKGPTDQNAGPVWTHNSLNDMWFIPRKNPLEGRAFITLRSVIIKPKTFESPKCLSSDQINLLEWLSNNKK
jgi:hypothetical protein